MPVALTWLARLTVAARLQVPGADVSMPDGPAPPVATRTEEFHAANVEIVGFDAAAIVAALRLRLPRMELGRHGGAPPLVSPDVYVQIVRAEGDTGHLRIVTTDGRAYERRFVVEVGQEVRAAASTTANLLFAIEQDAVVPDSQDAPIPRALSDPLLDSPVQAPAREPAKPNATPPPTKPNAARPPEPVANPTPPGPMWELAVGLQGAAVLGLGPPTHGGVLAGVGGGLGLDLRGPRGVVLGLDIRGLGRADRELGVGRLRIGVAGGYAWRRGRFELPVLLVVTLEPWWATQSGQPTSIYKAGATSPRHLLVGGHLRVTPALRLPVARGLMAVRVGPRLELGGSFAVDDGATVVGLTDTLGQSLVRLGGLELSLGLEVALQFGLKGRPGRLRAQGARGSSAYEGRSSEKN